MAATPGLCSICRAPHDPVLRERDVLYPCCARCLAPYPWSERIAVTPVEAVLLTMAGLPTDVDAYGGPLALLLGLARTDDDLERIRLALHAIDVSALTARARVAERELLEKQMLVFGLDEQIDACLRRLLADAASGLLRWRIDHLCDTVRAAVAARVRHHRTILEAPAAQTGIPEEP